MRKGVFITGTDTGIGKTVVSCCIIKALRLRSIDCGVMKPVQCAGDDAYKLIKCSGTGDLLSLVNPFFSKYAYAPLTAFKKEKIIFNKNRVINAYSKLSKNHQFMVVEGAGGLVVPITRRYFIADLVIDLNLPVVIVARLGLGTINHTLLAIEYARGRKIEILGIIFNSLSKYACLPEKTNPEIIEKLSGVSVLGVIGYGNFNKAKIDISRIINEPR